MKLKWCILKKFNNNKEANSTTTTTTENFKCYKSSTLFDAQNTGNRSSELLDFQIFLGGGGMPPGPPRGKGRGRKGPFSSHRRLLYLQWPLITKVIETPANTSYSLCLISFHPLFLSWICPSLTHSIHPSHFPSFPFHISAFLTCAVHLGPSPYLPLFLSLISSLCSSPFLPFLFLLTFSCLSISPTPSFSYSSMHFFLPCFFSQWSIPFNRHVCRESWQLCSSPWTGLLFIFLTSYPQECQLSYNIITLWISDDFLWIFATWKLSCEDLLIEVLKLWPPPI